MLEPTPNDPHSLAAKGTGGGGSRGSISFEDFTATTLRAVRGALGTGSGGTTYDPEILIGIIVRPPRDTPDLSTINTNEAKPG